MGRENVTAVQVVRCSTVVPEVETPGHSLWLSNLDLAAMPDYTAAFWVYRPTGDPGFFSGEKLRTSLSKALVAFYPLAGRIVDGADGRLEISCSGEGVPFVEAEVDCSIDELGEFVPSPEIRHMLLPPAPSTAPPFFPLLLQVTSFACGGVTLGVTLNHTVADGAAFYHFVGTWADISRGAVDHLFPPFLDRDLLRARSPPKVVVQPPVYRLSNTQEPSSPPPEEAAKPFSTAVFVLSKDQLAVLRVSCGVHYSTFTTVTAHAWRCVCKARGLDEDQQTRLHLLVDARSRLDPPLPRGFFGNGAFRMHLTARVGDVVSGPPVGAAKTIHEVTSSVGDEHVRSLVDFLELQEDLGKYSRLSQHLPTTDLCAVSWLGLPTYQVDFGWGRPVLKRRACILRGGVVYILRNPGNEGGVTLILSLEEESMAAFEKAFYHGLTRDSKMSRHLHCVA